MKTEKEKTPFKHRLFLALVPAATFIIRLIGLTMRITLIDPNAVAPQARPAVRYIYAFWHNQQILSAFFFRGLGIRVLVSRSRDGELIARVLRHFGFGTVRSSTSSGKVNALRGLARELRSGHHAGITPDGPRGPLYKAQPGAIFLGALSGHAVVPFGCATNRVWRLRRTWDQFEIPKPFSRAVIVFGQPRHIPRRMDEAQGRALTASLEGQMNALRQQARRSLEKRGNSA
ncbi:lysophospholipid acyltransferase family protein [candidate division FCPU426 bacterium]|nr:lysophospholipid acyltransferase family protein [candidate division FCPU426 bacterium]